MIKVALRSLLGRKLRFALTAFAIVLGVAMVSGTYVLTDTIKSAFNQIYTASYKNTDAVITEKQAFGNQGAATFGFSESLLAEVKRLPGVAEADGSVTDQATQLVGRDGKAITNGGAPNLGFGVVPNSRFSAVTFTSGKYPTGPNQVAIDKATADKEGFKVGDPIGISIHGPVQQFRISGVAELGGGASIGGATFAIFDLVTGQKLFHKVGRLDTIRAAAAQGVSKQELVRQIRPIIPPGTQVMTGTDQAASDSKDTSKQLNVIEYFLLAFGFIALFVGAFVIANTLSITIAQQTREFATMRTIGASRRQILRSVFVEALVLGVVASVVGLFLGLALAKGLNAVFTGLGIDLPKATLVFARRTVIVSLLLGILVTLLASLRPAFRATHVPPIAAVREGAVLPPGRFHWLGRPVALITVALGIALLVWGVLAHGIATGQRLGTLGFGVILLFIGVALVAPVLVRPIAAVVGWPAGRLGGAAGKLAQENSTRNPQRTASTAASLMIGLALVTFVAVLGAGLRASFENAVNQLSNADYALTSQNGFIPLTATATDAIRHTPGVTVVAGVRAGQGRAFGKTVAITGAEPGTSQVINAKWIDGSSPDTPDRLGLTGSFVDKSFAKDHHLTIGSPLQFETPQRAIVHTTVKGIFDPPAGGSPFGRITISAATFDHYYPSPANVYTFIKIDGGVTPANTAALNAPLKGFPDAKIQTMSEFKTNQEKGLNTLLNLLYVLLALSVIVSLIGMVNTLVLTVFERTRELGMLRAVGTTRRQVRRMIRHEAIITSLIGATLALPIGIALAALVASAVSGISFAIPWGTLIVLLIAAIFVGIVAAIFPARRAARLNVLAALQYE